MPVTTEPFLCPINTPLHGPLDLEVKIIPSARERAPWMIFLHEGLGSVAEWRDWPDLLCRKLGTRGLVYSRYGYGRSTQRPAGELWSSDYLLEQARDHLPALLQTLNLTQETPWIFGHSDGATIALLYAALFPNQVAGVAVAAPHVFVEPMTLTAIAAARKQYETADLRERLARYHDNPDSAFGGWNGAWLNPHHAAWNILPMLGTITCPVLAIQGDGDQYASLRQIRAIHDVVPQAECQVLPGCGHWPHREQPEILAVTVERWMKRFEAGNPGHPAPEPTPPQKPLRQE
jgi:pimeloyl-ACP methyl ester carboxylesterase